MRSGSADLLFRSAAFRISRCMRGGRRRRPIPRAADLKNRSALPRCRGADLARCVGASGPSTSSGRSLRRCSGTVSEVEPRSPKGRIRQLADSALRVWLGLCGAVALVRATLLCPEGFVSSVLSVAKKKLNTEVTEAPRPAPYGAGLRALCVGLFEGQRTRRSSFWLRPPSRAEPLLRARARGAADPLGRKLPFTGRFASRRKTSFSPVDQSCPTEPASR
jgi:hypothetical protein